MKLQPQQRPIIAGNWKMHMSIEQTRAFIKELAGLLPADQPVYLAVPATMISAAACSAEDKPIIIGGQNIHYAADGAFTGEISAAMLLDAGAKFVLIGHSERRHLFAESDQLINQKVHRALESGLQVILCIGETLEEREQGATEAVLARQITKGLDCVLPEQLRTMIVAYEPVWAIGTGKTATTEQVQQTHEAVRRQLSLGWGKDAAEAVAIIYGGSVKPGNAQRILTQEDVNGVLVGGASLQVESFAAIQRACSP